MCPDAEYLGSCVFFAIGSAIALSSCSWRFSYLPIIAGLTSTKVAMEMSALTSGCISLFDSSPIVFEFGQSLHAFVLGALTTLALLILVWVAQLTVMPITHLLGSGNNPRWQSEMGNRVRQLMTVYALIITFSVGMYGSTESGFFEQLVKKTATTGNTTSTVDWSIFLSIGKVAGDLVMKGMVLLCLPLLAVGIATAFFAILTERMLFAKTSKGGPQLAQWLLLLRAPVALLVFVASLAAIDLHLMESNRALNQALVELSVPSGSATSGSATLGAGASGVDSRVGASLEPGQKSSGTP